MPSIGAGPCGGGSSTASSISTPTSSRASVPSSARWRVNGRVGSAPVSLAVSRRNGEGAMPWRLTSSRCTTTARVNSAGRMLIWTTYRRVSSASPPKVSENQNPKRPSSLPTSMLCSSASSDSWSHLSTLPLKNSPAVIPGRVGVVVLGEEDPAGDHQHKADQRQAAQRVGQGVGVGRDRVLQALEAEPLV